MVDQEAPSSCFHTETLKTTEAIWAAFVGALENNQRFKAMKQMANQKKKKLSSKLSDSSVTFLLAFTPPSPWGSNSLSPKPQPGSRFTSSNWREGPRPYLQVTAYVLFWPEGWVCLSSASHNSEHEQGTTWTWLIHATRELQTNSQREQGISGNTEQTIYRL